MALACTFRFLLPFLCHLPRLESCYALQAYLKRTKYSLLSQCSDRGLLDCFKTHELLIRPWLHGCTLQEESIKSSYIWIAKVCNAGNEGNGRNLHPARIHFRCTVLLWVIITFAGYELGVLFLFPSSPRTRPVHQMGGCSMFIVVLFEALRLIQKMQRNPYFGLETPYFVAFWFRRWFLLFCVPSI